MLLWQAQNYLLHLVSATSKHSVHSPFVFDFVTKVLPHCTTIQGDTIENLRKQLCNNTQVIELEDFGAGFAGDNIKKRTTTIKKIAQRASRNQKTGELLFRICNHYKPQNCLELGTNLGISALYQLSGLPPTAQFTTIEGSAQLADLAQRHFQSFNSLIKDSRFHGNDEREYGNDGIHLIINTFDKALQSLQNQNWDNVFLDGNHTYEATIRYFNLLIPNMNPNSIIIFDDIYWSKPMTNAWNQLINHPTVSVSIDLFHFGICFLKKEQAKEHFKLRF